MIYPMAPRALSLGSREAQRPTVGGYCGESGLGSRLAGLSRRWLGGRAGLSAAQDAQERLSGFALDARGPWGACCARRDPGSGRDDLGIF